MNHTHYETARQRQCDTARVYECRAGRSVCYIEAIDSADALDQFQARLGCLPTSIERIA